MDQSLDLGAIALYFIYGGTLVFLVYLVFDIKKIYRNVRTQQYVSGYPALDKLKPAEGIIEVRSEDIAFKEPDSEKEYFSIPLNRIKNVSTKAETIDSSGGVLSGLSSMLDERQYLYVEFNHDNKWHTVQFSAHKASSVNDEVLRKILEARSNLSSVQK